MVGRKGEIGELNDCLESKKPEFVAIYGRRRVGKTYLVREFFNDTFSFYATGIKEKGTRQKLKAFKDSLEQYGDKTGSIPKDWFEAFSRLREILKRDDVNREYKSGKKVVFLDELPWMDSPRSDFRSALDYFWNSFGSTQKDLLFIVCGSATSWIIKNIVKDTGGFYNRLTRQICLMPFTLGECETLLEANGVEMTRKQILEAYMVFGGIPYYLNYLKPGYSLVQNIEMLVFKEIGPLRNEFPMLFKSLFNNAEKYTAVIREMANNKQGITRNDLINTGRVVTGKELTIILEELGQCGFIRKYHDFTKKEKGCFFQLTDPFSLFYLTFVESGKVDSWVDFADSPGYYGWCGLAFERVCLLHTLQIKKALGISGITSHEFSWRSSKSKPGAQIDMLIDRKDDVINVCEEKYTRDEFVMDETCEADLVRKKEVLRQETGTKKSIQLTLISCSGLKKNKYSNVVANVITGDDLFV
ncbi:MAG: ATP-binding protein [Lachnospiraceae bacterium]|nr:ATP-binding protein [Lachnospiraceae bacterium]